MADSLLPMTEVQTRALTKSRSFLVKHLTLANIADDLVARGVFTDAMLEEIEVKRTPSEKKQKLLTDLVRRPKDCFEKFVAVLHDNDEGHCAAEIKRNEELALREVQDTELMYQRLRSGSGRRTFPAQAPQAPHCPPMQFQPNPQAQHYPSASTSSSQPAQQVMRSPVQESNEGRQQSAGMTGFPSTGTPQVRTSSALPSGETVSGDDLDRSDAGRQLRNPGPQLQGACPMPVQVSQRHSDDAYKHETTPRGLALIINNVNFEHLEDRAGSESDCDILSKMLIKFGMKTIVLSNLKAQGMEQRIREFAMNSELQRVHSCVLAIMSHGGDQGKICGTDYNPQREGSCITVDDIKDMLNEQNCPYMKGKPKFFIIQACRGVKEDIRRGTRGGSAEPHSDAVAMEEDIERPASSSELPSNVTGRSAPPGRNSGRRRQLMAEADDMDTGDGSSDEQHEMADFFIAYATCPKYVAYRSDRGSLFIQTLVEVFQEHAHNMHVVDMLTKVNKKMSKMRKEKRMVACLETTLRYNFFLNPPRP